MLKDLLRSPWARVALLVVCGTVLLPSCVGGGLPSASVFLLVGVVALGGWLSACSRSLNPATGPDAATGGTGGTDAAVDVPPPPGCLADDDFDDSYPYTADAGTEWARCCLRHETRLCPPAPGWACNYALGTTFNPDGTCGYGFADGAAGSTGTAGSTGAAGSTGEPVDAADANATAP